MAGYSKVYFVGATGGYMGADGLAPPFFQIMVGNAGRQWMEPVYNSASQSAIAATSDPERWPVPMSIGRVVRIIPAAPDDPVSILDAVIAFYPGFFRGCPSLAAVEKQLLTVAVIDFDEGEGVPAEWQQLRVEAFPRFQQLAIFEADLTEIHLEATPDDLRMPVKIGSTYGTIVGWDGDDLIVSMDHTAEAQRAMKQRMDAALQRLGSRSIDEEQ